MADGYVSVATESETSSVVIVCTRRLIADMLRHSIGSSAFFVAAESKSFARVIQDAPLQPKLDLIISVFETEEEARDAVSYLPEVKALFPNTKIIIITEYLLPAILRAAIMIGVDAILTMEVSTPILQRYIDLVMMGQRLLPTEVAQMLNRTQDMTDVEPHPQENRPCVQSLPSRSADLSNREQEILQCLVNGSSNKHIARELNITEATVKVHVKALLRKTQVSNRTQAAIWALSNGVQHASDRVDNRMVVVKP
jgi:two-component system nitrate/nitrite response regulator NarL